jgi:hypothetical protein
MAYNPYDTGTTNINKDIDINKYDLDVDADVDVNANINANLNANLNVDVEKEVDIDRSTTNTNINVNAYNPHAFAFVKRVDVDVDVDKETSTTTTNTTNTNTNNSTNNHTHNETETVTTTENWTTNVDVHAKNIIQNSDVKNYHDSDVNDIDAQNLINVEGNSYHLPPTDASSSESFNNSNGLASSRLEMEDFSADKLAVGDSFNGRGNDGLIKTDQSNELTDKDTVDYTEVEYEAEGGHVPRHVEASLEVDGSLTIEKDDGHKPPHNPSRDSGPRGGDDKPQLEASLAASASYSSFHDVDPDSAFQYGYADADSATSGDGIGGDVDGDSNAADNEGAGSISGSSSASADGVITQSAFNTDISTGGNSQGNLLSINTVGNDFVSADDVARGSGAAASSAAGGDDSHPGDGGHGHGDDGGLAIKDSWVQTTWDDDVNDLDNQELINVTGGGYVDMEDFNFDEAAYGASFNGPGNDWAFDNEQTNSLVDNDDVTNTSVSYSGVGFMPFQHATAYGGVGQSGDGIGGSISGNGNASGNGADGSIAGSTSASGNAIIDQSAFNLSISVGANLQLNQLQIRHVGGDSTFADDIN